MELIRRVYYKNILKVIFVSFLTFCYTVSIAQSLEIQLAKEYLSKEEYKKAEEVFSKLSKKTENINLIYKDYKTVLTKTENYDGLHDFLKKSVKIFNNNIFYKIDYYLLLLQLDKRKEADKEYKSIESFVKNNFKEGKIISEYLIENKKPEIALALLTYARKFSEDKFIYSAEVATLYKILGKNKELMEELLSFLKAKPDQLENIKNTFQNLLVEKKELEELESLLYLKIQKEPEEIAYNEILLWLNLQKKEFGKAYIQAKAIDRRTKSEGSKLLQVGKIAFDNKDYGNALKYFESITIENKNSFNYPIARSLLIKTKEELVKNTFPIDKEKIVSLINDYKTLAKEIGKNASTFEALRSMALLQAFYTNEKDSAIHILTQITQMARNDEVLKAKVKLDLGDIYLLNGEPWEATLLYSQVEKSQKDEVLGHEAKLRNAKLSYYKGDFELAQEHLDVLKLATSREIANDAMNLSILIQDNLALDTSTAALSDFSKVDLLLFQNKIEEALLLLEEMERKYANHSLSDEILFQKGKIYRKLARYEEAINSLNKLLETYSEDILGDDAMFLLGGIYENDTKDVEKAKETYQNFLFRYPGSIFTVEVRKKFRLLRGDKL